ncbi:MAG: nuclear transport factor 2 family protein [bacterium]|nr:nuclear transport factor 2 family protein [bacterium]
MKKSYKDFISVILLISIVILSTSCLTNNNKNEMSNDEGRAMEKPIYDYVEGWYDKDPNRMELGIHRDLAKRSIDPGQPNGISHIDLASLLAIVPQYGGQNGEGRRIDIEFLDVQANIATAKVTTNDYVDYIQLCYKDDQWWIINVLWEFISDNRRELSDKEIISLEKPVRDYVEGWYDKDSERIQQGLHPDLAKRSLNREGINGIDQYTLSSLIEIVPIYGGQNGVDRIVDIEILDVQENIASVKVTSNSYIDFIHLCYWEEQWWVLNVLWAFK